MNIIIFGAGGFAREVIHIVEDMKEIHKEINIVGYIDKDNSRKGEVLEGYPILGDISFFEEKAIKNFKAVCAVGDVKLKLDLIMEIKKIGLDFVNIIHPSVKIRNSTKIGTGNIICDGNIITSNVTIGSYVVLNLSCTVGHDAIIDDYTTISPGANISGNVTINKKCYIGTNSAILQGKTIGENSIVGAGAVVASDISENSVAVGVPAKVVKSNE